MPDYLGSDMRKTKDEEKEEKEIKCKKSSVPAIRSLKHQFLIDSYALHTCNVLGKCSFTFLPNLIRIMSASILFPIRFDM